MNGPFSADTLAGWSRARRFIRFVEGTIIRANDGGADHIISRANKLANTSPEKYAAWRAAERILK